MKLLSIVALCLISCNPALAAGLHARQASQTVSLTEPSPTSTDPSVVSAYNTYSQKCGSDLNTATQAALVAYEGVSSRTDVTITDQQFLSWAAVNYPAYMTATSDCQNAELDYENALDNGSSGPSSSQPSSAAPGPSSAPPSSAAPPSSSAAPSSKPSSAPASASHSTIQTGGASSSPAQPSQSKPAGAAFHGPSWALALTGLVAVLYIS